MHTERTQFLDVYFDAPEIERLLGKLAQVTSESRFGYVVTPNVDHLLRLHHGDTAQALRPLYAAADYCLCDSKILARLARVCGMRLPVITGSDLTQLIFSRLLAPNDRIAVVGGDEQLMRALRLRFPSLQIAHHVPPMGLASDAAARRRAASFVSQAKARFIFICVGSPQQELIAAEAAAMPDSRGLALCVGAALEFLAGRQRRAPLLMRWMGLEWAHRLLTNPRRLWRRYLVEGPRIFALTYRWAQRRQ